jgi:hypothetical protein
MPPEPNAQDKVPDRVSQMGEAGAIGQATQGARLSAQKASHPEQ